MVDCKRDYWHEKEPLWEPFSDEYDDLPWWEEDDDILWDDEDDDDDGRDDPYDH